MDEGSFVTKMRHLSFVPSATIGKEKLLPLDLLNKTYDLSFKKVLQMYVFDYEFCSQFQSLWHLQRDHSASLN